MEDGTEPREKLRVRSRNAWTRTGTPRCGAHPNTATRGAKSRSFPKSADCPQSAMLK